MKLLKTPQEAKKELMKFKEKSIGFTPTMGALHAGHLSLIEKSLEENDISVVSIFVNPTQFDNPEDLKKYPVLLEKDLALLEELKVDFVFLPTYETLYPDNYAYQVQENEFSKKLCGAFREGHFTGVLTVVMKLLNIVAPTRAYFGEKDYQQLQLVKGMTEAFFMDVEIVPCPIVREKDGLAMSSRNLRLSKEERKRAPLLYKLLSSNKSDADVKLELKKNGFKVDYVETLNGRRFGAAYLGKVRLIDNVEI